MSQQIEKLKKLQLLVGNTPTVKLTCKFEDKIRTILAKYETFNFTGSIKDRMAMQILKSAYDLNTIDANDTIVEASSGNTAIAFAAMGAFLGHKVEIYMPDWLSEERKRVLRFYGAKLHEISVKDGGFLKCIELAEQKSQKKTVILDQNSLIILGISWHTLILLLLSLKMHLRLTI